MEISPLLLFWLTVGSLILGIVTGVLHDIHRLIRVSMGATYERVTGEKVRRLVIREKGISRIFKQTVVFCQDVFLFLFAAAGIVLLSYRLNDGQFRMISVVAWCFGFLFYYFTVGILVLRTSEWIVSFLRGVFCLIFSVMYKPIRFFVEIFRKIAKNILKIFTKGIAKRRKKVYNINSQKCIRKRVAEGFLTNRLP